MAHGRPARRGPTPPEIAAYGFDASLTNFEGMGPKLLPLTILPGDQAPKRIWEKAEILGEGHRWMLRSHITQGFADEALDFIARARDEGRHFYVNLWPDDVHGPLWNPAERWSGDVRERYLAVLEATDAQLGVLFDAVRGNPELAESTLILVCSDNGPARGQGRAGPFRGYKAQLHEGGIRSPLVAWGSGLVEGAGIVNGESVFSAMDLVPTPAGAGRNGPAPRRGLRRRGPGGHPPGPEPGLPPDPAFLPGGRPTGTPSTGRTTSPTWPCARAPGSCSASTTAAGPSSTTWARIRASPAAWRTGIRPGPGHVPGTGGLSPGHARGPGGDRAGLGSLAHARPLLARRAPRLTVHTISRRYEALDGDDVALGIRHLWLVRDRQQHP